MYHYNTVMNSPLEPGSSSPSTPSSGSPPPDEVEQAQASSRNATTAAKLASAIATTAGPSKRRLPNSGFGAASNTRDAKSRKREDFGGGRERGERDKRGGGDREGWVDGKGRRDKDELVDGGLVEHLRTGTY